MDKRVRAVKKDEVPAGLGVEFRDGRFYSFTSEKVAVIVAWPRPRAIERPHRSSEWRPCQPSSGVFDVSRYRRALEKKSDVLRTGTKLSLCLGPNGQRAFPLRPALPAAGPDEAREIEAYLKLFEPIPKDVISAVGGYAERHWQMLSLIARCPGGLDLHLSNPALAFALASISEFQGKEVAMPLAELKVIVAGRQRDALSWLGYPPTEAAVRVLRKVASNDVDIPLLLALQRALKNGQASKLLAHLPRVTPAVAHIAGDPFLLAISSFSLLDELSVMHGHEAGMGHLFRLRDIRRMRGQVRKAKPFVISSIRQLNDVYEAMIEEVNRIEREGLFRHSFPLPPFAGTDDIEPIESPFELLSEGEAQHNCAATYSERVADGKAYLYRVLFPERATLCVLKRRGRWVLSELKASCNRPVGYETAKVATGWFIEASAGTRASERKRRNKTVEDKAGKASAST